MLVDGQGHRQKGTRGGSGRCEHAGQGRGLGTCSGPSLSQAPSTQQCYYWENALSLPDSCLLQRKNSGERPGSKKKREDFIGLEQNVPLRQDSGCPGTRGSLTAGVQLAFIFALTCRKSCPASVSFDWQAD